MIQSLSLFEGLKIALYGFVTVFIMLAILMLIIMVLSKVVAKSEKKEEPVAAPVKEEVKAEEPKKIDPNKVYVGEISLINVDEKTAACLMAIISDETKIPLDNLIFKKIQLIEED